MIGESNYFGFYHNLFNIRNVLVNRIHTKSIGLSGSEATKPVAPPAMKYS